MKHHRQDPVDLIRRRVVQSIVVIPALSVIGCGASAEGTSATALDPTPACDDGDDDPTPYFKSSAPLVESVGQRAPPRRGQIQNRASVLHFLARNLAVAGPA